MFTGYSENRRSRQMLYNRGNTGPGVHQVVSTAFCRLVKGGRAGAYNEDRRREAVLKAGRLCHERAGGWRKGGKVKVGWVRGGLA